MYLTYAEYTAKGGALASTAYTNCESEARAHVDRLTHGRITAETRVRDAVKNLMFKLVVYISSIDGIETGGMKSFSNGSVSATYATPQETRAKIAQYCNDYLYNEVTDDEAEIPLMYAGVIY